MQVLVVGRAKTGTTVLSKTIQHSIPGAEYLLEPKRIAPFEDESNVGRPLVVKIIFEHWGKTPHLRDAIFFRETAVKFDKSVAIVRDPRDELISRLYYIARPKAQQGCSRAAMESWIDALRSKEENPSSVSYLSLVQRAKESLGVDVSAGSLHAALGYYKWTQRPKLRLHTVRYEDFVAGRTDALADYLGVSLSGSRELGALDYTRRSEATNNWKSFFTPEDVAALRPQLDPTLVEMGYVDWDLEPAQRLDPASGSEYVRKISEAFLTE